MRAKLVRSAVAGSLLGASVYLGSDVLGDYTTYRILRDQGLAFAERDEHLAAQIGTPFADGPWYNASIGFAQSGHVASITFPLKGSRQITDVTVRAVRRPGVPSAALYNLMQGEWKVLEASAMAPQPGGMVRPRSIMPQLAVPKVQDGVVVAGEDCEECKGKAPGGGKGTPAAGSSAGGAAAAAAGGAAGGTQGGAGGEGAPEQAGAKKRRRFWFF